MQRNSMRAGARAAFAITFFVAACGGGGAATPTPATTPAGATTAPTTAAETPGTSVAATNPATGEPNLQAPAEIGGGSEFEVAWTGPNAQGDYVTIVALGATKWTNEDYFNTTGGTPQKLSAPTAPGDYELWYVSGADDKILFRLPVKVLAFVGSLTAADSAEANKEFDVAWTGPNGTGDYVTIVKVGATQWTNEDYFNVSGGTPQKLLAPIEPGAYELWYVTGSDSKIQVRRPITVTPTSATLDAPATAGKGSQIQVAWTGPNGPGDYVTIVPAGSAPGAYLSYFNTNGGSPGTLTAPDAAGNYEVWYVAGQGPTVLAKRPIQVK